jgi:cytochrome c553
LKRDTKKLADLAHALKTDQADPAKMALPDADPTLGFVSNLFSDEVHGAYQALNNGQTQYARRTLREVLGYCIACHTRHDQGPSFPKLQISPELKALSPMQKGELFTATRQFDSALQEFEKVIADPQIARTRQLEWGRAVRHAFAIAVRVKQDPALASQVLDRVMDLKEIPPLFRENIPVWKKSLDQWKAEGPKHFETEEDWYREAVRLDKAAQVTRQFLYDHAGDVLYLRASLAAHEMLTRFPHGKYVGEALLLAGTSYEFLDDELTSPLPERYFEACIRRVPHTDIAHQCYLRLEESIYFGYTGSSGTSIPERQRELLAVLAKLAIPQ